MTTGETGVYRGAEGAVALRDELLRQRQAEARALPVAARAVLGTRHARIAAGKVLVGAGVLVWISALWPGVERSALVAGLLARLALWVAPLALGAAVAALLGAVTRRRTAAQLDAQFAAAFRPGDDAIADLDRLRRTGAGQLLATQAAAARDASVLWPLAGLYLYGAPCVSLSLGMLQSRWSMSPLFDQGPALALAVAVLLIFITAAAGDPEVTAAQRARRRAALGAGSLALFLLLVLTPSPLYTGWRTPWMVALYLAVAGIAHALVRSLLVRWLAAEDASLESAAVPPAASHTGTAGN